MYCVHRVFTLALLLAAFACTAAGSETVTFAAKDGLLLSADIYAPHDQAGTPFIVLFHQAGSSRGEYSGIAPWLNSLGYNCMAVDQRSGEVSQGVENETARRAAEAHRETGYLAALPDIRAALEYARKHYGKGPVIAWGSSYSAALVLQIAGVSPGQADGVLAFSPGEYFERAGKSATWIAESARHIRIPVFISSARGEADQWAAIYATIESGSKAKFVPATDGRHGSRALWAQYPDSGDYRAAVRTFLEQHFPAGG